jgi:glutamate dehydrogenase/leucine dehydrogenase
MSFAINRRTGLAPAGPRITRCPGAAELAMTAIAFDYEPFCDDLGPIKVVNIYEPSSGLKAMLVVDNVSCGPSIGGVRMAADVSTDEVFRLARAMTMKNASAGLPHGGGKAGIMADPETADKERLVRAFAIAIRDLTDYIPGPDMGTDESCMAWVQDEIGRAVGLPRVLGGIPLDEIGATGYGLVAAAEVASGFCDLELSGARVAIEGFGNVGRPAARLLVDKGAVLVAASDSKGAVHDADGIDVEELAAAKAEAGSVTGYARGRTISNEELFAVPCDVLVPAARPDCIREDNVDQIQAKLILQGANIPATAAAEARLHERGVLSVPDFICNAGGVICAAVEFHGGSEATALEQIADKIRHNTSDVLVSAQAGNLPPRQAAMDLAGARVREAMALRRTL